MAKVGGVIRATLLCHGSRSGESEKCSLPRHNPCGGNAELRFGAMFLSGNWCRSGNRRSAAPRAGWRLLDLRPPQMIKTLQRLARILHPECFFDFGGEHGEGERWN